jgi:hypothetical protein
MRCGDHEPTWMSVVGGAAMSVARVLCNRPQLFRDSLDPRYAAPELPPERSGGGLLQTLVMPHGCSLQRRCPPLPAVLFEPSPLRTTPTRVSAATRTVMLVKSHAISDAASHG